MQIENQSPPLEAALAPEYAFGSPLDASQFEELKGFAVDSFGSWWAGADTPEEFAANLAETGEAYTPEAGAKILRALGSTGLLRGIENNDIQTEHAAETESGFQAILAGSVINGYNALTSAPRAYRALVGEEQFSAGVEQAIAEQPLQVLTSIGKLETVLDDEEKSRVIGSAYDALQADDSKHLAAYMLTDELVQAVGHERLEEDVRAAIEQGEFFGKSIYGGDVLKVAEKGLITAEEAMDIVIPEIAANSVFSGYNLEKIALLSDDTAGLWKKVQDEVLRVVRDDNSDPDIVEGMVKHFTSKYTDSYSESFAQNVVGIVRENRGDIAVVPALTNIGDTFGESFAEEVLEGAVDALGAETDDDKKQEIVKTLVSVFDRLDEDTKRTVIAEYASSTPDEFLKDYRLIPKDTREPEENEFLRDALIKAQTQVDPETIARYLDNIRSWFPEGDTRFKEHILPRLNELTNANVLNVELLKEYMDEEQQRSLLVGIMDRIDETEQYYLQTTFSKAIEFFGTEDAKELFAEQIRLNPGLAIGLLNNNQMLFDGTEVVRLIDTAIEGGKINNLMHSLGHLAFRLPKQELTGIMDKAVEDAPKALLEQLENLTGIVNIKEMQRLAGDVMRVNPAIVLGALGKLPEGVIGDASEVISFMEQDSRTALAPKYFKKIMRRLPKAEDTTAFHIMAKEAVMVYSKINRIMRLEDGTGEEMLLRIRDSIGGSSERSELDSISLAVLMAVEEVEPGEIQNAADAKMRSIEALNKRLGLQLVTTREKVDEVESKIGSVVPLSMYALFTNEENKGYLRDIVASVDTGEYQAWKYGELGGLMDEGIMPKLAETSYVEWQSSGSTESRDVVADDASSVANKIREVIGRGLLDNPTIEKLAHLDDPIAMIDDMKTEAGQIGKNIGAVHRQKAAGEISEEEAAAQVAELQSQKEQLEIATNTVRLSRVGAEEIAAGYLFNEKGRPTKATIEGTLNEVVEQNGVEAIEAFGQLQVMLDSYRNAASTDIGDIVVSDVDDFQTTLEIGANPVGSCQHYELGQFNNGLLGYFEPSVKIVGVRNDKNRLVARSVVRLTSDLEGNAAMVLEPTYMSQASDDIEQAIVSHAKAKAEKMGVQLYVMGDGGRTDLEIRNHRAPAIYSDIFGGIHEQGADGPAVARKSLIPV